MILDKEKVWLRLAKKGINMSNLAETLDCSTSAIYKKFGRKVRPSSAYKIAEALECKVEDIVT